jgi:hypothetical protein
LSAVSGDWAAAVSDAAQKSKSRMSLRAGLGDFMGIL